MIPRPSPTDTDPAPPPLPPGVEPLTARDPRRVGPFRLVGRLGSGGMGVVYAALDDADRRVAVKCAHRAYARDPEFRARFAREAAVVRRVRSAAVPAFVGADARAQVPWLATEYVPGPTVAAAVRDRGPLDEADVAGLALGAAEALVAIHAADVVHRDLKPGNVVLAPDGPRVLDLGIAKALADSGLTRTGGLVGTPGWIAPEQLRGTPATGRSDVFTWANLVVYAATGSGAFGTGDTGTLARRVLHEPPDLDGVPGPLRPHLERALAKDPEQRPTSAELRDALTAAVADELPTSAGHGATRVLNAPGQLDGNGDDLDRWTANTVPPRPWPVRHRRGLTVAAAATALVLVAGGGALLWDTRAGTEAEGPAGDGEGAAGAGEAADDGAATSDDTVVTVENDPDDPASVIRYIEDADGDRQPQLRLSYAAIETDRLDLEVTAEYLMETGEATVRSSDFGMVAVITPEDRSIVPDPPNSSGSQVVLSPEEPTGQVRVAFFTSHGSALVHHLPPETASEESREIPIDRPGGVCFIRDDSDDPFGPADVAPHDTTLAEDSPQDSCVFEDRVVQ
ncbi:serine/threonine protein kinase [Nocardiopsis sp. HNM0947]|uniref:Serine/threonine protein kinase n=1 Tax=Nocardiopsis coralli TaxID=2772213 RepID=A0ABR9P603_9ACTN|nr:serine/threonine-protein kinase [Nocardiopsis coralli]MBE2999280.1 serine/threonine protein kinase [Nocardiopsis coralli]